MVTLQRIQDLQLDAIIRFKIGRTTIEGPVIGKTFSKLFADAARRELIAQWEAAVTESTHVIHQLPLPAPDGVDPASYVPPFYHFSPIQPLSEKLLVPDREQFGPIILQGFAEATATHFEGTRQFELVIRRNALGELFGVHTQRDRQGDKENLAFGKPLPAPEYFPV